MSEIRSEKLETVRTVLIGFPDGRHVWVEMPGHPKVADEYARRVVEAWRDDVGRERCAELQSAGCQIGFTTVTLAREALKALDQSDFPWPERLTQAETRALLHPIIHTPQ